MTQVDSAYCSQCLVFHDAGTAASLGFCGIYKCCPLCMAVASVTVLNDKIAFYKCGYCDWTSQSCSITAKVTPTDDGMIGKEQMQQASKDLVACLQKKTDESSAKTNYQRLGWCMGNGFEGRSSIQALIY